MAEFQMTEAEAGRDFHAVLERARAGNAVIIKGEDRPDVVIQLERGGGRTIDEAIALAEAFEARLGYAPVLDDQFGKDLQEVIDSHREPLDERTDRR